MARSYRRAPSRRFCSGGRWTRRAYPSKATIYRRLGGSSLFNKTRRSVSTRYKFSGSAITTGTVNTSYSRPLHTVLRSVRTDYTFDNTGVSAYTDMFTEVQPNMYANLSVQTINNLNIFSHCHLKWIKLVVDMGPGASNTVSSQMYTVPAENGGLFTADNPDGITQSVSINSLLSNPKAVRHVIEYTKNSGFSRLFAPMCYTPVFRDYNSGNNMGWESKKLGMVQLRSLVGSTDSRHPLNIKIMPLVIMALEVPPGAKIQFNYHFEYGVVLYGLDPSITIGYLSAHEDMDAKDAGENKGATAIS